MRALTVIAALLALTALATPARAEAPAPPPARKVVLAPLATLGSEIRVAATAEIRTPLAAAIAAVPGIELIADRVVEHAVKRARRPELRACDGKPDCLAELGKLVGADQVVYGELGGLGDVQVVYLKLVSSADAKEVRATSLELGAGIEGEHAARAAAFRLLDPDRYVGSLVVDTKVAKAAIYVDGRLVAHTPTGPLTLPVGTHALRVTHPEFRDFVRFVTIEFGTEERVKTDLAKYKVVSSDIHAVPHGQSGPRVIYQGEQRTPWYRRWYSIAGFSAVTLIGSAIVVGLISNGIDADRETTVGDDR